MSWKNWVALATSLCLGLGSALASPAYETGEYENLFVKYGFATQSQVTDKIQSAYQQLFYGDAENETVYYEAGDDMAFIKAIDSRDIRSEGMSYGMIIAVMMDDKTAFDKLWKFSKTYMQHQSGDRKYYFSWQLDASPPYNPIDINSAPDGEEYYAMALMFAANRWGDGEGIYNYNVEANLILNEMVNKVPNHSTVPMINPIHHQIIFTPNAHSEAYTDPSYHVPAFYELFSRWGTQDNAYWQTVADTSRDFFPKAAHPVTGLYSDYAEFDGTPKRTTFNANSHLSAFDQLRTIQNIAVDYLWFGEDERAVELANRILSFYQSQGDYVTVYSMDGIAQVEYRIEAHVAMNAVGAMIADREIGERFIGDLWTLAVPEGQWRYYNGLLYLMGLLHTAGEFKIYHPQQEVNIAPTAQAQDIDVHMNEPVDIVLTGRDVDGEIALFQLQDAPLNGVISGELPNLRYTPDADFVGQDSFSFRVIDDEEKASTIATIKLDVVDPNNITPDLGCSVQENVWNTGFTANVTVTNQSDEDIQGWAVVVTLNNAEQAIQHWNASFDATVGEINAVDLGYNGQLNVGESTTFGFNGEHGGQAGRPAVTCRAK